MRHINTKIILSTVLLFATVCLTQAATKGRIMTNGKVTMYQNDRIVSTYTSQGPLNENALIACEGTCMVKMQGISLSGVDQTRFALKESADSINLYVEKGKIFFIISDVTHQFAFFTPNGHYIKTEGFIAPASVGTAVRGSIEVTDTTTVIAMDSGSMIVQTVNGPETIKPGRALVFAMAAPPEEDDDDKVAAVPPCSFFDWGCNTLMQKGIMVGAGAGLVVGGAIIIDNSTGGSSASPNR